jgi:DNA-binding NarL/FixJ family response regulator
MASKPLIQIDNEVREMTANEIEAYSARKAEFEQAEAEAEAKIATRESALAKLAALGLTEEEIAAL